MIGHYVRYAVRVYLRTPAFSSVATLVLAIAIAVATAVFSFYSHLSLQPVAGVQSASRWASIGLSRDANEWLPFGRAQYELLSEALTVPEALVATSVPMRRPVEADGSVNEATTVGVSRGFFGSLGVPLILGTDLAAAGADPAAAMVVVSERFWRERLDARPAAIGGTIRIDDRPYTVVGVAGGGFAGLRRGASREDIWVPLDAAIDMHTSSVPLTITAPQIGAGGLEALMRELAQTRPLLSVSARLPSGTGIERLRQELQVLAPRFRDVPSLGQTGLMRLEALRGTSADPRRHLVLVRQSQLFVGGAVLVLLVASLNLASFMLARAPARLGELRTRLAIGATPPAMARQLFVEAALLIGVAILLGLVLHHWLRSVLLLLPPFADAPADWLVLQTDWRVALFVIGAALCVTLVAGLLPAIRIARDPGLSLVAYRALGQSGQKLQPLLACQFGVATLVVLAATLFVSETWRLERAPLGFDHREVVAGELLAADQAGAPGGIVPGQSSVEQMEQFARDLVDRTSVLPGVQGVALASAVPFLAPAMNPGMVELAGAAEQPPEDRRRVYYNRGTPDLFGVLGARFLHGRPYSADDPHEVVVSRTLARRLWNRDEVIGERLALAGADLTVTSQGNMIVNFRQPLGEGASQQEVFTVVGVVDDIRYAGADEAYPPMLYRNWSGSLLGQHYVVRASVAGGVVHAVIDELVRERFPQRRAALPATLTESMRAALRDERARGRLALGTAAIALLVTVLGLGASMQHMVDARRGELAVRKAIGATDWRVVAMILRRAGAIVATGSAAALLVALLMGEYARSFLLGLNVLSPTAWTATLALVACTGVAAACLPALRAGRVDPALALRHD